jgi:hypothetical protein
MTKLDQETKAHLDMVLEEACRGLPHGGDHGFRKEIATRLMNNARKGNTTPEGLRAAAHNAVAGIGERKSA